MISFKDLESIYTYQDEQELVKRESKINFEDPTNIQFTSGTTGFPKGTTLTHHNILNNGLYIGELMKMTDKDKVTCTVPLYHCFGMVIGCLTALNYGASMVFPSEAFDPAIA